MGNPSVSTVSCCGSWHCPFQPHSVLFEEIGPDGRTNNF